MQKNLLFAIVLMFVTQSLSSGQEVALVAKFNLNSYQKSERIALTTALSSLSEKYDVYFSYDVEILKAYTVPKERLNGYGFEKKLETLIKDTALNYKKVGKKNYVVFKTLPKRNPKKENEKESVPTLKGDEIELLTKRSSNLPVTKSLNKEQLSPLKTNVITVRGLILDEYEDPMIGAAVVLKSDPATGTVTDIDGNYKLDLLTGNEILLVSYIGYQTQEVEVGGRSQVNITMAPDYQTLDEVIVVGFGTQKKRFTTGAISKVKGEDLENSAQTTVEGALQGRVAGVMVTSSDAMAGSPVSVRIRGTSSIVASSEPLYVVDGIPIVSGNFSHNNASSWKLATAHESNALAQLNPADIESIEILKDASAAAIYGSRGANGVVLITTKRGKEGKTKFDVGFQNGFSKETNRVTMLDSPTYLSLAQEAYTNSYYDAISDNDPINDNEYKIDDNYEDFWGRVLPPGLSRETAQNTNTDWIDHALQKGFFREMNLAASGGNDKTVFYIGGTYRDEKGIFVGNNFKRYNGRVNLDHKPTENLSLGARMAYTVTDSDIIPISWAGGLGTAQSQALPYYPVFNADGTYFNPQSGNNVVAELANTEMNQKGTSILGNIYAQLKILDRFTLRSEFGINNIYKKEFYYRSAIIEAPHAIATSVLSESINWNTNNTLSYSNVIGDHAFDVLVGMNATKNDYFSNIINGEDFPNPSLKNPENAATRTATIATTHFSFLSVLSRLNYRFKDKYLFSASIRRDGSSRFGKGNRWGTFPAVSLGWILSEEDFLSESNFLSFLKLRATFGITGNAEIGNFEYFGSYTTSNYVDRPGIIVDEIDNNSLSWESTKQYDFGLDFGLWDGRIEGGVDVYLKQTSDLLTEILVSSLSGVNRATSNVGSLENKGVDLSLTSHNLSTKKFKWVTTLNLGYNANKVTDLGGLNSIPGEAFGLGAVGLGQPVGARFLVEWAGIASDDMILNVTDPESGNAKEIQVKGGDELFINQFGEVTNIYDSNDQKFMGNPNPNWTGGISNSFSWNNFDLSFLFTFAAGHDLANEEQRFQFTGFGYDWNMWSSATDRWQQAGDQTDMQRLTWASQNRGYTSSRVLYDADYARLKDVTIAYNLPKAILKKWGLGSFRVYAKGTNLATFTKYPGWDPEYNRDGAGNVGQGKSWLPSPQAQSISFGVNVSF